MSLGGESLISGRVASSPISESRGSVTLGVKVTRRAKFVKGEKKLADSSSSSLLIESTLLDSQKSSAWARNL